MRDRKTGFLFKYSVEKTAEKGMGVFARERISKGSVVWRHMPCIFTVYDESTFRSEIEKLSHAEVVYELEHVFGLEDFPGCLIRALDDGVFINHSKDENLATNTAEGPSNLVDVKAPDYLQRVSKALCDDRYSLIATKDIQIGEELTNNYAAEDDCPPYYYALCDQYGVNEDFIDDE
ncbi:MAG: SET domain-containing protein [Pseudomonadota bacterium]